MISTVPWLRWLVAGLPLWRPDFDPESVPRGICSGQSGTGTGFSPNTSVFPSQFHFIGAPLLGKMKIKTDHLSLHHKGCTISLKAAVRL